MSAYLERLHYRQSIILAVDPSVVTTGVCVLRHWMNLPTGENKEFPCTREILDHHLVKVDCESIFDSASRVATHLGGFCQQYKPTILLMEQPPQTLYNQEKEEKKRGKNYCNILIGRAQSVFKTFAVAYLAMGKIMEAYPDTRCVPVLPVQWQLSSKSRGGQDSKEWSLGYANVLLSTWGSKSLGEKAFLRTKEDANIADAICMANLVCDKLETEQMDIF